MLKETEKERGGGRRRNKKIKQRARSPGASHQTPEYPPRCACAVFWWPQSCIRAYHVLPPLPASPRWRRCCRSRVLPLSLPHLFLLLVRGQLLLLLFSLQIDRVPRRPARVGSSLATTPDVHAAILIVNGVLLVGFPPHQGRRRREMSLQLPALGSVRIRG